MLESRRISSSLLCLLLTFLLTCHLLPTTAANVVANRRSMGKVKAVPDPIRVWPQLRPSAATKRRTVLDEGQSVGAGGHTVSPTPTPTTGTMTTATSPGSCPTTPGVASALGRRASIDALATINSLSSALASATAVSQELVLSLEELQASAELLAASASSALLAASSAVSAAEASAAEAISAAQQSAASSLKEALAGGSSPSMSVTAGMPDRSTTRTQTDLELEAAAEDAGTSMIRVTVAVVVSIVVSALCSILGFYLFVRYRRTRRKRQEEQAEDRPATATGQQHPPAEQMHEEVEQSVTEALARAVVSYIEKEQMPAPVTINSEVVSGVAHNVSSPLRTVTTNDGCPVWPPPLHPPPPHPPPPPPVCSPLRENMYAVGRTVSVRSPRRESTDAVRRTISSRSARSPRIPRRGSERSIYEDIITSPLEPPTVPVRNPTRPGDGAGQDGRRDSNWPLPKAGGGDWV
ncbi:hypothetical protein B0H66DRAFT_227555 [Apodospora peruviana]|uniref:Uncharacterized protein n=1 Tax=Apodospora peruviana TaxID=516989 RepID=A0AAE0I3Z5_9PEZI|nr:hypothetical protein B0H66DRAFT_227555 [Apodospora peruviana]